jgi:hypothetical protein
VVGPARAARMLRPFGEPDHVGCVRRRLYESAELGKGQAHVEAIQARRRRDVSKIHADPGGWHAAMLSVANSTTRSYCSDGDAPEREASWSDAEPQVLEAFTATFGRRTSPRRAMASSSVRSRNSSRRSST